MKHPNEAMLALHAGGDLGFFARRRIERHVSECERCSRQLAESHRLRDLLPQLAETPEISWNRLAAEMRANIRLGLAAGECVRGVEMTDGRHAPFAFGARAVVACASVLALLVTGLMLERPVPGGNASRQEGIVVQSTINGIQVRDGGRALRLMHGRVRERDVTYVLGAQGSMRARYVDPDTGYITINNVYVE
jgi:hypothetical protein